MIQAALMMFTRSFTIRFTPKLAYFLPTLHFAHN